MTDREQRPPSVDALARTLVEVGLPPPLLVDAARAAVAAGDPASAPARAEAMARALLRPVVNATGVLLHTNLGRAPFALHQRAAPMNLELSLDDGRRGHRQAGVGPLLARLCQAEAALVVNNGAAAVALAVAAVAGGREVAVSRGESVEIGGRFRIPEVVATAGAVLRDVGTTNRTRADDFRAAIEAPGAEVAAILRVHPSNFQVEGFTERPSVAAVAALGRPVVVDIGSGLVDATCPWLPGPPPAWLAREPAARQCLAEGAALVTFSGDKLLGGPQAGIVAGEARWVEACARHPLARAVRVGGHVLAAVQEVALAYLDGTAAALPFWAMATAPVGALRGRAEALVAGAPPGLGLAVVASEAVPGAGAGPGAVLPSVAVTVPGLHGEALRRAPVPVVARQRDGATWCDLRSVLPDQDAELAAALASLAASAPSAPPTWRGRP